MWMMTLADGNIDNRAGRNCWGTVVGVGAEDETGAGAATGVVVGDALPKTLRFLL